MRALNFAEIEEVTESLILANTPGFLLDRMLRSQLVQRLVEEATEEELIGLYQSYSCSDPIDTNAAAAYAALIAILVKRREDCKSLDMPIQIDRLDWEKKS